MKADVNAIVEICLLKYSMKYLETDSIYRITHSIMKSSNFTFASQDDECNAHYCSYDDMVYQHVKCRCGAKIGLNMIHSSLPKYTERLLISVEGAAGESEIFQEEGNGLEGDYSTSFDELFNEFASPKGSSISSRKQFR